MSVAFVLSEVLTLVARIIADELLVGKLSFQGELTCTGTRNQIYVCRADEVGGAGNDGKSPGAPGEFLGTSERDGRVGGFGEADGCISDEDRA